MADAETANDVDTAAAEPVVKTTDLDLNCISHLIKKQGPLGALKHVISYGENVGLGATTLTMSAIAIARHQEDASKTMSEGNSTDKNADSSLRIFMAASKSAKERHQVDRQTLLMFVRNCVLFKVSLICGVILCSVSLCLTLVCSEHACGCSQPLGFYHDGAIVPRS